MATIDVNGIALNHVAEGPRDAPPLVLVHGSWDSLQVWEAALPQLARRFRVVAYDRRGHGASEGAAGQGSVLEDVADLAGLIEALGLAPAWVAGNSFGASIALRLAAGRPELLRGVAAHEPPLFALLAEDPATAPILEEVERQVGAVCERLAAGDDAGGAELFVDTVAMGPGAWAGLPPDARAALIVHAPTFLDETRDPEQMRIDLDALARYEGPMLLTRGGESPPGFAPVVDRLASAAPRARVEVMAEAGHVPHETHPEDYAAALAAFAGLAAR